MGLYLCRRVFVNWNQNRGRFWYHDPSPRLPVLGHPSGFPVLAHSSRQERTGEDAAIQPLDVIRRLYGFDCARRLESLFEGVGLWVIPSPASGSDSELKLLSETLY